MHNFIFKFVLNSLEFDHLPFLRIDLIFGVLNVIKQRFNFKVKFSLLILLAAKCIFQISQKCSIGWLVLGQILHSLLSLGKLLFNLN